MVCGASLRCCASRRYYQSKPVGVRMDFMINDGDLYVMSEKAVGHDWKKRNTYTLRHAAGAESFAKK